MIKFIRAKLAQWDAYKTHLKRTRLWQYIIVDTIETVLVALIFALLIRKYFVQTSLVYSGSMEPTMMIGDRLFVNKFVYHYRDPGRGEIILFKSPYKDQKEFVKRLIALPGEKVLIDRGNVYINGKLLTLPGINFRKDYDSFGPETVPTGNFFVLGDNRSNSADSRVWGYVPRKDLIGKAFYTFWPINRMQILH